MAWEGEGKVLSRILAQETKPSPSRLRRVPPSPSGAGRGGYFIAATAGRTCTFICRLRTLVPWMLL